MSDIYIKRIISALERCERCLYPSIFDKEFRDCEYTMGVYCRKDRLINETIKLLKDLEEERLDWIGEVARLVAENESLEKREAIEFANEFMSDEVHNTAKLFRRDNTN